MTVMGIAVAEQGRLSASSMATNFWYEPSYRYTTDYKNSIPLWSPEARGSIDASLGIPHMQTHWRAFHYATLSLNQSYLLVKREQQSHIVVTRERPDDRKKADAACEPPSSE